jgi:DNA polymerase-3 subunit alpha (Gram-positive type)
MFFSKFVAFDLETTGLVPQKDEIIEIGAVKFTVKVENGQVVPQKIKDFQTFVKPNMMIPAEATRVNHITDKMVENAPAVADCLRQFTAFCGQDTILVAHNADFDTGFLKEAYEKNPQLLPGNPIIDSLRLSRSILPELKSHKLGEMAMLFKRQQLISMKIDSGDMHRAVYDCEMLMEVFVSLLKRRLKEKDWEMGKMLPILAKFGYIPAFLNKK